MWNRWDYRATGRTITAPSQPKVDPATGHVVVFNGEIYNFRELRRRLGAEAQELRSTGDTAVMLRALGLYGPGAVGWLRLRLLGQKN